jgi:hemerythrin
MDDDIFTWQDEYSVDFEVIDNQHKQLVKMTNDLFKACNHDTTGESARAVLKKTLRGAVEYAQVHFYTEEKYMSQVNYPELPEHKAEHGSFIVKILDELKRFEDGNQSLISLANFLKEWLLHHIAVSDKKYAPYLKNIPK